MSRSSQTAKAAISLVVFAVIALMVTGLVISAVGGMSFRETTTYRAIFSSASRVIAGDDVRVGGVRIGEVTGVEVTERGRAAVTFTAEDDLVLTRSTKAEIRYLNLVGNRYLALLEGTGDRTPLPENGTIPMQRTEPALDLTVLFNGFKPLFAALSPEDVNRLAMEIIRTLQGEGGTIRSLLAHTASLTTTLADRDQVIGRTIENLNRVLATLGTRRDRFGQLIGEMQRLVSGLAGDRTAIGDSLAQLNELTAATGELVTQARPAIRADIEQLHRLAGTLTEPENKRLLRRFLRLLPEKVNEFTRAGSYGTWFNFYICDLQASISVPEIPGAPPEVQRKLDELRRRLDDITIVNDVPRCQP